MLLLPQAVAPHGLPSPQFHRLRFCRFFRSPGCIAHSLLFEMPLIAAIIAAIFYIDSRCRKRPAAVFAGALPPTAFRRFLPIGFLAAGRLAELCLRLHGLERFPTALAGKRVGLTGDDVKCSKIVYRLCNHMVYSFDILKASQKKRKRWRWLGRKGLWK